MFKLIVLSGLLILLSACAPDPRSFADADAIRARVAIEVADRAAARSQQDAMAAMQQKERELVSANLVVAQNALIWIVLVCITVLAVSSTTGASVMLVRVCEAVVVSVDLRARLIYLPKETMQYPLVTRVENGKFIFANPNDDGVMCLDANRQADRDKLFAAGNVALAGILAVNAVRHKDPAGVMGLGYNNSNPRNNFVDREVRDE